MVLETYLVGYPCDGNLVNMGEQLFNIADQTHLSVCFTYYVKEIHSMVKHSEYIRYKKQCQKECRHDFMQIRDIDTYLAYTHCKKCH